MLCRGVNLRIFARSYQPSTTMNSLKGSRGKHGLASRPSSVGHLRRGNCIKREEKKHAKRHQQRPAKEIHGRNNPEESTVVTTGASKKKEIYEEEAPEHGDAAKSPPEAKDTP